MIVPDEMADKLARLEYPCADRLAIMLGGDVPEDAHKAIEYDLQLYWSDVTLDCITVALLLHLGVNPAVMSHAASRANPLAIWSDDARPLIHMTWRGDTQIHLGAHASWISATRMGGNMHNCNDMEGGRDRGAFAIALLPDQLVAHLAGQPLRNVLSHPALDPLNLTITEAVNHEYHTHLRTNGQTPVRRRELTALLPPPSACISAVP